MSFGFIVIKCGCVKKEVSSCRPSADCLRDGHKFCPHFIWESACDCRVYTDDSGEVIRYESVEDSSMNLLAVEGYCFHDEDENCSDSDVPCGGSDAVSLDCLMSGGTCRYFGWCRAGNFEFTIDSSGNVVNFEDFNGCGQEQE
ncbi:MAG: hypothetical protein PUB37_03145 [Firmicutes bacterium]|nr:hypothetical protein [Bacillota bacterium]